MKLFNFTRGGNVVLCSNLVMWASLASFLLAGRLTGSWLAAAVAALVAGLAVFYKTDSIGYTIERLLGDR